MTLHAPHESHQSATAVTSVYATADVPDIGSSPAKIPRAHGCTSSRRTRRRPGRRSPGGSFGVRGILSEELCGPFHDLEFLFALVDAFPRASEPHTLRGTDAGDLTAVDAVLPHPPAKTSCADAEVCSNVLDWPARTNKRDCTLPEFSGVLLGHKNEPFRCEMNSILTNGKGNQTVGQVTPRTAGFRERSARRSAIGRNPLKPSLGERSHFVSVEINECGASSRNSITSSTRAAVLNSSTAITDIEMIRCSGFSASTRSISAFGDSDTAWFSRISAISCLGTSHFTIVIPSAQWRSVSVSAHVPNARD